ADSQPHRRRLVHATRSAPASLFENGKILRERYSGRSLVRTGTRGAPATPTRDTSGTRCRVQPSENPAQLRFDGLWNTDAEAVECLLAVFQEGPHAPRARLSLAEFFHKRVGEHARGRQEQAVFLARIFSHRRSREKRGGVQRIATQHDPHPAKLFLPMQVLAVEGLHPRCSLLQPLEKREGARSRSVASAPFRVPGLD